MSRPAPGFKRGNTESYCGNYAFAGAAGGGIARRFAYLARVVSNRLQTMKKPFSLVLLATTPLLLFGLIYALRRREGAAPTVLVCDGPDATRYHRAHCQGLVNCSQPVRRVARSVASAYLEPCGLCY